MRASVSERDLQQWLASLLYASGVPCQVEVQTHHQHRTRADIITDDTVIELKRVLDREKIHQAYSQAQIYAAHLGKPNIVLAGLAPSPSARHDAISAIVALQSIHPTLTAYWLTPDSITQIGVKRGSVLDRIHLTTRPTYSPTPSPPPAPRPTPTPNPITVLADRRPKPKLPLSRHRDLIFMAIVLIAGLMGGFQMMILMGVPIASAVVITMMFVDWLS